MSKYYDIHALSITLSVIKLFMPSIFYTKKTNLFSKTLLVGNKLPVLKNFLKLHEVIINVKRSISDFNCF